MFLPKGSSTTASGKVIPARTITRQDGWRWRFVRAERGTATGVEAQYYDDRTGQRKTVAEGGDDRQRLKHVYSSKSHATRAAKSNLAKRQRGKSKFEYYLAVADCSMLPNQRVTLTGWSDAVSNIKWVIESVETSLGPDGLKPVSYTHLDVYKRQVARHRGGSHRPRPLDAPHGRWRGGGGRDQPVAYRADAGGGIPFGQRGRWRWHRGAYLCPARAGCAGHCR